MSACGRASRNPRSTSDDEDDDEELVPWDRRILEQYDVGIDETLLEENLRRTPQERLERMLAMARWLESARERSHRRRRATLAPWMTPARRRRRRP